MNRVLTILQPVADRVVKLGHGAEHYALVTYAMIETIHLPSLTWWVSLILVMTGVCGLICEHLEKAAS